MVYHQIDSARERIIPILGKALFITLSYIGLAHAELENELQQQQEIEQHLQIELEAQKKSSAQSYNDVIEFAKGATINRDEQVNRLQSANSIWDEFIEKICTAENLESIGTRAERASYLQCMIKKYKEKDLFFKSLI